MDRIQQAQDRDFCHVLSFGHHKQRCIYCTINLQQRSDKLALEREIKLVPPHHKITLSPKLHTSNTRGKDEKCIQNFGKGTCREKITRKT
jgi:hypothetical protein